MAAAVEMHRCPSGRAECRLAGLTMFGWVVVSAVSIARHSPRVTESRFASDGFGWQVGGATPSRYGLAVPCAGRPDLLVC